MRQGVCGKQNQDPDESGRGMVQTAVADGIFLPADLAKN